MWLKKFLLLFTTVNDLNNDVGALTIIGDITLIANVCLHNRIQKLRGIDTLNATHKWRDESFAYAMHFATLSTSIQFTAYSNESRFTTSSALLNALSNCDLNNKAICFYMR